MKFLSILFISLLFLNGCAKNNTLRSEIEMKSQEYNQLAKSKNVQVFDTPYVGASIRELDSRSTEFDRKAVLSQRGTLSDLTESLESMFPSLKFQVGETSDMAKQYRIFYEGKLKGLLNYITLTSGYGWQYTNNTITFSKTLAKTYTIYAMPGENSYSNNITNKSKDSGSNSGGDTGQTVSSGDTSLETAQTSNTEMKINTFESVISNVKGLLSKNGTVTANQTAGTITVYDEATNISLVDTFIDEINEKMSRQVALTVQVWSLELKDNSDIGFNLNVLFEDSSLSLLAGNLASFASNNVAATIMSGKLKNSQATLQALKEWGNASSVTNASGIVMSNQALPALAVDRSAYLASVSSEITEYGKSTEITPGEITTGFAMTVIPHILEKRELILQYNINLSHLKEIQRFTSGDVAIDLPQTSNRAFAQTMRLKMGQTLVLAGYQQDVQSNKNSIGFLRGGNSRVKSKTLLIITIQVESADV